MTALFHVALGSALVGVLLGAVSRRGAIALAGTVATVVAALALLAHLAARWVTSGWAPLASLHESLAVLAFFALATGTYFSLWEERPLLGVAGSLLATLALSYASLLDPASTPLVPALRSNWLLVHVTTCLAAYAGLGISFLAAAAYLWRSRVRGAPPEGLARLEGAALRAVLFAYPLLTIGIGTGAVWANSAWGSYWGWDPKETWSLVTWLLYGLYLHARFRRGWRGEPSAWLLVAAFAAMVFTYFGAGALLRGLHSYA